MATSFQKKTRVKVLQIPGAKPSLHNNQLLVSTGVPSFDNVLGGGIAVGSVVLIEEDIFGGYARLLLKYYLAEAVVCGHAVHLSTAEMSPQDFIKDLPSPLPEDVGVELSKSTQAGSTEELKIAWRYQNLPKVQMSQSSSKFGHYYDLTKSMDVGLIDAIDKTFYDPTEQQMIDIETQPRQQRCCGYTRYQKLLQSIRDSIQHGGFSTSAQVEKRNILRIGLHSLGSPLWGEEGGVHNTDSSFDPSLPRFLIALRSMLRSAFAVCTVTVPTHLYHDVAFTRRLEKLCDTVVSLESFAGSDREKNPVYRDYHGLFNIIALPRLNSLTCHMPETLDWAFKLRRKKFTIEKLHLPPELSETTSRPQEDVVLGVRPHGSCAASVDSSRLDF